MKEYGIKTLFGILGIGIIISIFHIANESGGSALGNVIETLGITSLVLFLSTIILLVFTFKENIRKTKIWLLLIISLPLSFQIIKNLSSEYYLKIIETSTPKEFIYNSEVSFENYNKDKLKIERLIDSLLKVKIIEKPSELALRYFNGKTYNDSIERDWAIDLPLSLKYEKSIIDTLFYSKNGDKIVAGLMINKVYNKYRNQLKGGIEFMGKGFVYNENKEKPIEMLKYSVSGYNNYKKCSERLRYFYFKKIGTYKNEQNMNDIRFLTRKEKPVANTVYN